MAIKKKSKSRGLPVGKGVQREPQSKRDAQMPLTNPPDRLADAKHISGSTVRLVFSDDFVAKVTLAQLGLNANDVDARTAKVTDIGLVFRQTHGRQTLAVDSATLRYVADPKYAARIDESIRGLHMNPTDAQEAARLSKLTRDPRWNDVGDEDDLIE